MSYFIASVCKLLIDLKEQGESPVTSVNEYSEPVSVSDLPDTTR